MQLVKELFPQLNFNLRLKAENQVTSYNLLHLSSLPEVASSLLARAKASCIRTR